MKTWYKVKNGKIIPIPAPTITQRENLLNNGYCVNMVLEFGNKTVITTFSPKKEIGHNTIYGGQLCW